MLEKAWKIQYHITFFNSGKKLELTIFKAYLGLGRPSELVTTTVYIKLEFNKCISWS